MISNNLVKKTLLFNVLVIVLLLNACKKDYELNKVADFTPVQPAAIKDGYTDKLSYYDGDTVNIYINPKDTIKFGSVRIYTLSGKVVDSVKITLASPQSVQANEPWANGYGYKVSGMYIIRHLRSGIYLIGNKIPFIAKSNNRSTEIVIVYPNNTVSSYSVAGGEDGYTTKRAIVLSFLRPVGLDNYSTAFFKWMESYNNYSFKIISDIDMEDYSEIVNSDLLIVAGHSEYWSREARKNFDLFVNSGKNAMVLSGNSMWWQVRYSPDKTQMICYKYTTDPISDPLLRTINWFNPVLEFPIIGSIGADFNYGGFGSIPKVGWQGYKIIQPKSPLFEGTSLKEGDIISLLTHEYDGAPTLGFDANSYPILDKAKLDFYNIELLGFNIAYRIKPTLGTFIVFQKRIDSGIVINVCSTDWCGLHGFGGKSGGIIQIITANMIDKLMKKENIFTP